MPEWIKQGKEDGRRSDGLTKPKGIYR